MRRLVFLMVLTAMLVGAGSAAATTCSNPGTYAYSYAFRNTGHSPDNNYIDITVSSASIPIPQDHVLAYLSVASAADGSMMQVGIARGPVCALDGNPGGYYMYLEWSTGYVSCGGNSGRGSLGAVSPGSTHRFAIVHCTSNAGCGGAPNGYWVAWFDNQIAGWWNVPPQRFIAAELEGAYWSGGSSGCISAAASFNYYRTFWDVNPTYRNVWDGYSNVPWHSATNDSFNGAL